MDAPFRNANKLWRYEDVARFLQCSPKTVRKWAGARTIPVVKIGRLNRFDPEAIRAWAAEQAQPADRDAA